MPLYSNKAEHFPIDHKISNKFLSLVIFPGKTQRTSSRKYSSSDICIYIHPYKGEGPVGEDLKSLKSILVTQTKSYSGKDRKFQMQNECFGELKTLRWMCEENGF